MARCDICGNVFPDVWNSEIEIIRREGYACDHKNHFDLCPVCFERIEKTLKGEDYDIRQKNMNKNENIRQITKSLSELIAEAEKAQRVFGDFINSLITEKLKRGKDTAGQSDAVLDASDTDDRRTDPRNI